MNIRQKWLVLLVLVDSLLSSQYFALSELLFLLRNNRLLELLAECDVTKLSERRRVHIRLLRRLFFMPAAVPIQSQEQPIVKEVLRKVFAFG